MEALAIWLMLTVAAVAIIAFFVFRYHARNQVLRKRAKFIQQYAFPSELRNKLQRDHALTLEQSGMVIEGLRQYFLACLSATRIRRKTLLGMPSKAVDSAWHEFILMTREYEKFCKEAFGEMLHHTPGGSESSQYRERAQAAQTLLQMKRPGPHGAAWAMLGTMPLLFALDRELGVKDGHIYDEGAFKSLEDYLAASGVQAGSEASSYASSSSSDSGSSWFSSDTSTSSDSGGSSCSGGGSSCGGGGGDS